MTKQKMEQHGGKPPRHEPIMNHALWTVQWLLALLFLFAGGMKLFLPIEAMTKQMPLPGLFLRFIGMCEALGAIGLILPALLRIRQGLTPLAAAGLAVVMIGATLLTLEAGGVAPALMPLVVGLLSVFVAYGRWAWTPKKQLYHF
jgi:uncharacterized membrane protein YphA (DoxX/SURF4 family)